MKARTLVEITETYIDRHKDTGTKPVCEILLRPADRNDTRLRRAFELCNYDLSYLGVGWSVTNELENGLVLAIN